MNIAPMKLQPVVVLTGMSGAGKQLAATFFEDKNWRVIDNLPPRLIPLVVREHKEAEAGREVFQPLCLICDVRGGRIEGVLPSLEELRHDTPPSLVFLDASDEELVRRFKETRRTHPLFASEGGIFPALARERELLAPLKERANAVLDTTGLSPNDFRARLLDTFLYMSRQPPLTVTVASFGFKYGTPLDADLLFDVRFLRNPHYVDELRPLDGRTPPVEAYVMDDERTGAFLERLYDLVGWSLPHYVSEGKAYLTIAIGCTGGKHRSVVVAEKLSAFLDDRGYRVLTQHRDVSRSHATASAPVEAV